MRLTLSPALGLALLAAPVLAAPPKSDKNEKAPVLTNDAWKGREIEQSLIACEAVLDQCKALGRFVYLATFAEFFVKLSGEATGILIGNVILHRHDGGDLGVDQLTRGADESFLRIGRRTFTGVQEDEAGFMRVEKVTKLLAGDPKNASKPSLPGSRCLIGIPLLTATFRPR